MQNFLPEAFSKSQLVQRIGLSIETKRLSRLYHACASKGIENQAGGKWRIKLVLGRGAGPLETVDLHDPLAPLDKESSIQWF
jgi:hypothetical protein